MNPIECVGGIHKQALIQPVQIQPHASGTDPGDIRRFQKTGRFARTECKQRNITAAVPVRRPSDHGIFCTEEFADGIKRFILILLSQLEDSGCVIRGDCQSPIRMDNLDHLLRCLVVLYFIPHFPCRTFHAAKRIQ